ncbi:MAG: aminopeptidase P family protein [Chloroflexi bacterium]|uniref:Aminopeptidase P family protein n=1 Tax=Candidatus Chlorohelix allophototropha TaxID=3003348 RepID=A0A8T7MA46_9CHLR|nr:aminopeptidase P family protein [Chloroflexota bacterium]WJW68928.1 Xaa-Pro peptidase family protein [Chloroflexota bacterium L227-S17]
MTSERLSRVREYLSQNNGNLEAVFVTKPENRAYLSGFTGSYGFLLITATEAVLFTDGRYTEQATAQAQGWNVIRIQRPYEENVAAEIKRIGIERMGFEAEQLTFAEYKSWTEKLPGINWIPTSGDISKLRRCKDPQEVALIKKAVAIADDAFEHILGFIKPGITERDVAIELEFTMRRLGAERNAFDTIVASGWRSALPHGRASEKVIQQGEFVTIDFGAHFEGYNSDITRTIFVGEPDSRQREIYQLVLAAQLAGVEAVKPGAICKEVDAVSRQILEKAGELDYFLHSLGHSLGREVHEAPFLSTLDTTPLEPGMVVTVEPGLYYSNWGGVRIEDDLLVTAAGAEVLPRSPKELICL